MFIWFHHKAIHVYLSGNINELIVVMLMTKYDALSVDSEIWWEHQSLPAEATPPASAMLAGSSSIGPLSNGRSEGNRVTTALFGEDVKHWKSD